MATLSEKLQYILTVDAEGAIRTFQTVGKSAEKELGKAQTSMDRLGAKFTMFGVGAMATAGVAGVGMAKLGMGAANLNEAVMKTGVIFGNSTAEIISFGNAAAVSLGLSKRAALDAASRFATFGKVVGKSGTELVDYSEALTKRAVDLASFWNTDLDTAFTAISSGLQGEALPLRQFGILLDDITLKNRAFAQGIYDGIGPLNAQQRVTAASAEIMSQNTDSIGDYARTSANLPNQQKRFTAELQNTKDALGAAVLPAMKSVVTTAGDALNAFNALGPGVQRTVGTVAGFGVAALGVAGVASTVVGQVIKMRATFAGLGTVASTAAGGVGILAAAFAGLQVIDAITSSGSFADLTPQVENLAIALGNFGDSETSVNRVARAIDSLVTQVDNSKSTLEKSFDGLDILFTSADGAEKWAENFTAAFEKLRGESPAVAQTFVDSLKTIDEWAKAGSVSAQKWLSGYSLSTVEIDKLQATLDRTSAATKIFAGETGAAGDAMSAAAQQAQAYDEALKANQAQLKSYYDDLSNQQAFSDLLSSLGEMQAKLQDTSVSATDQASNLNEAKRAVINYAKQVGDIPLSSVTEILTILNTGNYKAAADALERLAAPRKATFEIQVSTTLIGNQLVGAGLRNEMEGRTAGKSAADAFSSGFAKGIADANKSSGSGRGGGSTVRTPTEVMADWDKVFANLYKLGEWDLETYRSQLQHRLGEYAKYSDDYMRVYDVLQQLMVDEAAKEKQKAEDAAKAKADEVAQEQAKVDAMYELGEISRADYRAQLDDRLRSTQKYSSDYMRIVKEIAGLDKEVAAEQKAAADEAAKAEQDRLAAEQKASEDAKRAAEEAQRAQDDALNRAAMQSIVAANIGGATYATINTAADPNAVINAIQQYERRNGPGWRA